MRTYNAALSEGLLVGQTNTAQYLLANMGHIALLRGDAADAERLFTEASVAAHDLGADGSPLATLGEGLLARRHGSLTEAERHFSRALRMLTTPETRDWAAAATSGLGFVAELSGDLTTAEQRHRTAYLLAKDAGHVGAAARAVAVEGLACVAAARGDGQSAATLLGAAARWRAEAQRPATPLELHDIERAEAQAQARATGLTEPQDLLTAPESAPHH
jgi:Flp pilus assembly protein TadD